jgi:hypothetical protein
MRSILLCLPLLFAARFSPEPTPPACGEAALAAAPDEWDAQSAVTGDLTLDGHADVAFWKRDGAAVMLYIASCDGDRMVQSWRFRLPVAHDCPPTAALVVAASLMMDAAAIERVCASGDKSECEHLRRENQKRQAATDAGGRELRIGGHECGVTRLRWFAEAGGFVRFD